ncbi:MAG: transposase zinc-binding domain-containing protein [Pseudomonadota bacterium]
MLAEQGRSLPGYVVREFEDYLKCGRLEHGFLRVRCESCHHEKLAWAALYLQLQETRFLSLLWCKAYGGQCSAPG